MFRVTKSRRHPRLVAIFAGGGGYAPSSLATVLARDGYQVVVLERQTAYWDKVRGEPLACCVTAGGVGRDGLGDGAGEVFRRGAGPGVPYGVMGLPKCQLG